MSIAITDPALLAQLAAATGPVEVRDPAGNLIGRFETTWEGKLPPGVKSPISDEELQRRRQYRDGKPLSEILERLRDGQ
jgi:hypothetical protein